MTDKKIQILLLNLRIFTKLNICIAVLNIGSFFKNLN